jgi:serine/threonine protein kinase
MDVVIQVLLALRHLHSLGILHRDVKTRNILASHLPSTGSLRVKLGDFGIARITTRTAGMARTTIGTPLYSSPEVFAGAEYDGRVDVWGLGCVAYELVSGQRPFQSGEFQRLADLVQHSVFPPLSK